MLIQGDVSAKANSGLSATAPAKGLSGAKFSAPMLSPQEALERLFNRFKRAARRLSGDNCDLRDDLFQEMCLGVLESTVRAQTREFYGRTGVNRAKDYLKWNHVRTEFQPLDKLEREPACPAHEGRLPARYLAYLERRGER